MLLKLYPALLLLTWLSLLHLWRRRRESRGRLVLVMAPLMGLTLISVPAVGHGLLGTLEWQYEPLVQRPPDAGAIVVLSGNYFVAGPYRPQAVLGASTLYRCIHAVELYREGRPCLVLLTGGRADDDRHHPACAAVMGAFLTDVGVSPADLVLESEARSTYENALRSAHELSRRHIRKIVLVTEAFHMPRAVACFRKQGLEVVPAPCHYQAIITPEFPLDFIPDPAAASHFLTLTHEWVGILWYWLNGRL
jgi:uncharacterized SAM-binding protein YcdF (DUF218 family)